MPGLGKNAVKQVLYGSFAGTQDVSVGLWVDTGVGTPPTQSEFDTYAATMSGFWLTAVSDSDLNKAWTNQLKFSGLRCYHYTTPSTHADLVSEAPFGTDVAGEGSTAHPTEVSIVCSNRSAVPGRSGRGRSYWPANALPISSTGQFTDSNIGPLALVLQSLYQSINGEAITFDSLSQLVAIASFTKGNLYPVVRIEVDDKPDTQRRRQDKVPSLLTVTETI